MEIMRVTIKSIAGSIKSLTAILAAATLILTSCRDDAASTVALYPVVSSNVETVVETRALSSDYKAFEVVGTRIQAYALAFNKYIDIRVSGNDADGIFLRKIPGWTSTLEVTHDLRYRVYAYSPVPFPAETISFDYNGGTPKLTFTGLSVITETDPMASVAAAGGTGDTPATDFSEGSFSIGVVNILTSPKTKVWLAMNHIYSKATISFVVNAGYDAIRTIVLKNATVSIPTGILPGLSTYTFAKGSSPAVATWSSSDLNGDAKTIDLMFGPTAEPDLLDLSGDPEPQPLNQVTLSASSKKFAWFCFLPKSKPALTLKVVYDIYDKEGNLIRADQTVTNANILANLSSVAAGNNYNITVRVNPTYLYQLSDSDASLELIIE